MQLRRTLVVMSTAFAVAACSDQPVSPDGQLAPSEAQLAHTPTANADLLAGLDITGTVQNSDGSTGTFTGTASITELAVNAAGELVARGTLNGIITNADGVEEIADFAFQTVLDLTEGGQQNKCDILFLQLGPIDLDLLGLLLNISQITINLDAQSGPGNLLGNLLCAVAHLLDGGPLSGIENLLNRINNLLG